MILPESIEEFVGGREEQIEHAKDVLQIPRKLRSAGINPDQSNRLAATYVDNGYAIRHAYIPAWNGLIRTLRQRVPSFWVTATNDVYDMQTGRHKVRSYRSAELLWGFASIDMVQGATVETRRYVGLHALPDNYGTSYDEIARMPNRRQRQSLRQLGGFREWFCLHANIVMADARHQPITRSDNLSPRDRRRIDFFNLPQSSGSFLNPQEIDKDINGMVSRNEGALNSTELLHHELDRTRKHHIEFLYGQARQLCETTLAIEQSMDVSVPDDGSIHIFAMKPEWLARL